MDLERLEVVSADKVAERFLGMARELVALGATRLEAFGVVATFAPRPEPRQPLPEQREVRLSADALELQARANKWAGGDR